jgi:hypothetical protein
MDSFASCLVHPCVIGSYDLGKLGWAGQSIVTFFFFSFLSFYFLQPNSSNYYILEEYGITSPHALSA